MAGIVTHKPGRKVKSAFLKDSLFQYVLAHLQKYCPPARPVTVRPSSFSKKDTLGTCQLCDGYFLIYLNSALGGPQAVDVLVHEWSHALGWNYVHEHGHHVVADGTAAAYAGELHDSAWGCAYATVYRHYLHALNTYEQEQRMRAQTKKTRKAAKAKVKK